MLSENHKLFFKMYSFSGLHFLKRKSKKRLKLVMYSKSKKKRNTPIYFNTNYRTVMKLVPIIMDYYLLQFDASKFFLDVPLHGVST